MAHELAKIKCKNKIKDVFDTKRVQQKERNFIDAEVIPQRSNDPRNVTRGKCLTNKIIVVIIIIIIYRKKKQK